MQSCLQHFKKTKRVIAFYTIYNFESIEQECDILKTPLDLEVRKICCWRWQKMTIKC